MTWTAAITIALLGIVGLTPLAADLNPDSPEVAAPATLEPIELNAAEAEVVATSMALFEDAGLALPSDVIATFHDDSDACNGNLGLSTIENDTPRVRVCWSHADAGVEARLQTQALVHELAHAWANENLTDATRDAFVEFSGAETWNLAVSAWNDRGTERAADLITWALLDPAVLFVDFEEMSCHIWAPAFELLTGTAAPATLNEAC